MIIASRELTYDTTDGEVPILISILVPEQHEPRVWSCKYKIGWPDGSKETAAWGVDSVQALVLALQMIGSELYSSDYHRDGVLKLSDGNGGYGFPVASTLRDMLIGDDAKYM